MKTIFMFLSHANAAPKYFSDSEADLEKYMNHLKSIGFNGYSYDEFKAMGFVQSVEVEEKRLNKVTTKNQCYIWLAPSLESGKACKVVAFSDNLTDMLNKVGIVQNIKLSKSSMLNQYRVMPDYKVSTIDNWNVLSIEKI